MDKQKSRITIGVLTLLILTIFALTINLGTKRKIDVKDLNGKVSNKQFAFYLQNSSGNGYTQSSSNTFPTGYELNISQSKCINNNGTTVSTSGVLSANDNKVTVKSSQTIYCTLYFDIAINNLKKLCGDSNLSTCMTSNKSQLGKVTNLDTSLKGDLYRYRGTNGQVTNNYICIGSDKCTNGDENMYRIIGITSSGELKVIATMERNENNSHYLPNDSSLGLSANVLATINSHKWYLGNVSNVSMIATQIYAAESASSLTETKKIGKIRISDYYFASNNETCQNNTCANWISEDIKNSDGMRLTVYPYNYPADMNWVLSPGGNLQLLDMTYYPALKISFYTTGNTFIKSGSGTESDPYVLNLIKPTLGDYIRSNTTSGRISSTLLGDMYRFQGTNTQVTDNYICIGSDSCGSNSDYMYRIIGITEDGRIKVIKSVPFSVSNGNNDPMYPYADKLPANVLNKIDDVQWCTGRSDNFFYYDHTGEEYYSAECSSRPSSTTKFNYLYYSDFLLSVGNNKTCYGSDDCSSGWLTLKHYISATQNDLYEKVANLDNNAADQYMLISVNGKLYNYVDYDYSRLTFYLKSDNTIKSGTGTARNPYILNV